MRSTSDTKWLMKHFVLAPLLAATSLVWTACETVETIPQEAATDLERGLKGEGKIVPIDQKDDPFINENNPYSS